MNSSLPKTPSFLSDRQKHHFIDGEWRPSASGQVIETRNPSTGEVIATLARGGDADVDVAVAAARRAFEGPWSRFTPSQRHALMMKVHDIIEKNGDDLTLLETYDMGSPVSRANSVKDRVLQMIAYFATLTSSCLGETIPNSLPGNYFTMTIKAPLGVIG